MWTNYLLMASTRASEMKMFSTTNLDDTSSRKSKSSCAVNWTHLFVTLMIKKVLWLHFWGSSNENQGCSPATHTVKKSWISVINVFFFRCKIWFHQCAAIVGCFCNYIHLLKLQIWQRRSVKVGQTHRSVWDSQEKDIVGCECLWPRKWHRSAFTWCADDILPLFFQELRYSFSHSIMFIGHVPHSSWSAENWGHTINIFWNS